MRGVDNCPWCGASSEFICSDCSEATVREVVRQHHYFKCLKCLSQGPSADSESNARLLWNSMKREGQKSYKEEFANLMEITITALDVLVFDLYENAYGRAEEKSISMDFVPKFKELFLLWHNNNFQYSNYYQTEHDGEFIRRRLSYHIDQGEGEFSEKYPSYPKSWQDED